MRTTGRRRHGVEGKNGVGEAGCRRQGVEEKMVWGKTVWRERTDAGPAQPSRLLLPGCVEKQRNTRGKRETVPARWDGNAGAVG